MLIYEDNVEEKAVGTEQQLDKIAHYAIAETAVDSGIENELRHAGYATSSIEQDGADRPAFCGLPLSIQNHLRDILDQGETKFDS